MCMVNFSISPNALSTDGINQTVQLCLPTYVHMSTCIGAIHQIQITVDLIPPPLADESYYCVFGDLGSSVMEGNLIPGVNFTDLTCVFSNKLSNMKTTPSTLYFSLKSNITHIDFLTLPKGLPFYDCREYSRQFSKN